MLPVYGCDEVLAEDAKVVEVPEVLDVVDTAEVVALTVVTFAASVRTGDAGEVSAGAFAASGVSLPFPAAVSVCGSVSVTGTSCGCSGSSSS